MADGDVKDLFDRLGGGRTPTELAAATGRIDPARKVAVQGVWKYANGKARYAKFPSYATVMGLSDALGLSDDTEMLLAFGRSSGRLRIPAGRTPALVLALRPNVTALDPYPGLVADLATAISDVARVVRAAEHSQAKGLSALDDLRKRLVVATDRVAFATAEILMAEPE